MAYMRRRMHELLALHTGQTVDRIAADTDRDYIMSAQEAVDYGMVDHVVSPTRPVLARAVG